jgi:hypothetical protein
MPIWGWLLVLMFLVAAAAALVLARARLLPRRNDIAESRTFALVTPEEAESDPYPYVYVEGDGTTRELHPGERSYLEMKFSPFDGGRPYVKTEYLDCAGHATSGYCRRSLLPPGLPVGHAPEEDPSRPIPVRGFGDPQC